MKKKINFRYFTILAISLILVIIFLVNFLENIKLKTIFLITSVLISTIFIILVVTFKRKLFKVLASIFIIFCIISTSLIIKENKLNKFQTFNDIEVSMTGKISSNYSLTSTGIIKVKITDVKLYSNNDFLKLNGYIDLYLSSNVDTTKIEIGRYIETKTKVNFYKLSTNRELSKISNEIYGYAFGSSNQFDVKDKENVTLREIINRFVYNKLCKFNIKFADIGFAMIFGNTEYVDKDIETIFTNIGISHLLAVSGFNIVIILSIFSFLLKKTKLSIRSRSFINVIVITIYSYLCNFSPSVVRASLMAIISMYAKIRGKPYDRLSSLSFVACLLLIINPLYLFDYSFILSFSSVLSMIIIQPTVKRILSKFFYNRLTEDLSMCISVQLGLVLIQFYLFGRIPTFSIISNMLVAPIIVIGFYELLIAMPIVIVMPFLNFSLRIFDFIMNIAVKFGNYINSLGTMITFENISFISVFLYGLIIFTISDFLFENRNKKLFIIFNLIFAIIIVQSLIIM